MMGLYQTTIRNRLPRKLGVYNGITARKPRLFDDDTYPDHKAPFVAYLREAIAPADTVVEVGGGFGIATVLAAQQARDGRVITYEPSHEMRLLMRETIRLNDVDGERIDIRSACVGPAVDVWGDVDDQIGGADLPAADVVVLDCEGSEHQILDALSDRPRAIIVEAHRLEGTEPHTLRERLQAMGYETDSEWRWVLGERGERE